MSVWQPQDFGIIGDAMENIHSEMEAGFILGCKRIVCKAQ